MQSLDEEARLRAAFLRVADPVGTPVSRVFLATTLACLGGYGLLPQRGWVPRVVPFLLVAAAAYYGFQSLRARHLARRGSVVEVRERFIERARSALDLAPSLPVRSALWLGLGAWAWVSVARGGEYPLGGDQAMALFLGAMGTLMGARYLVEWRIEIPALRREFEEFWLKADG